MSGLFCQDPNNVECIDYKQIEDKTKYNLKGSSIINIHPICIDIFSKNFRESYRNLSKFMKNDDFNFERTNSKNRIYTFSNTAITNIGIIITENNYYFNGGCYKEYNINKEEAKIYQKILENNPSKKYKKVISIAELWGEGVWHFPIEAIVGLKNITDFSDIYLHITKKNKLCLKWIELLKIPIPEERIIDGDIFAETLIIPEMSGCGSPKYDLTIWLKNKIYRNINLSLNNNLFILIKRNNKRIVKNHDELEKICKTFCQKLNLQLYIHDDINLPTLKKQMEIFNKAKIVIGPHGAGAVNLLASKPGTHFLEFLPEAQNLINTCYIQLANHINVNYYGIPYKVNENVDLQLVIDKLLTIEKNM